MKYFGWIFLFFITVYIMPLGSRPMLNPYEFRNAEMTREMVTTGNWTAPERENLLCAEKLPMHRWLTGASFRLFGKNTFANRLPSALTAGLTALLIALLIQQSLRNEKLAALAAMVYMSCSLIYLAGTTAGGINTFAMFVTGTQGLLFLATLEKKFNRRKILLLILAGIFTGAGFLCGGFAAIAIPALSLVVYLLCTRKWKDLVLMPVPVLAVAALTVLPWALAINRIDTDFWHCIVFTDRLSGVFFCGSVKWWVAPLFFAFGLLPAAFFIPAALFPGKEAWKNILKTDVFRFSISAFFTTLLYFSAFGKHPAGVLLCFPPAAILIAAGLQAYFNSGGHHRAYNWVMSVWGVFMLLLGIAGIAGWFFRSAWHAVGCSIAPFPETILLTGGFAAFFCGALMLYSLRGTWRSRMYLFFFGLALLPLGVSWCIPPSTPLMPENFIREFVSTHNLLPGNTIIIADDAMRDAAAWSLQTSNVNSPENAAKLINDPRRQSPVLCIITPETAKTLPPADCSDAGNKIWQLNGFECILYPVQEQ